MSAPSQGVSNEEAGRKKRIAFLGNSFLYVNDVPRLYQELCGGTAACEVDSCLRSAATWDDLLKSGNGTNLVFGFSSNALQPDGSKDIGAPTVEALLHQEKGWDFVVTHTHSQEPARPEFLPQALESLHTLAPMLQKTGGITLLMVTPALA
eukprot:NODE_11739_length_1267_cov_11.246491.p1 GENE.NODE_11739_length_1267_cov_11.246491~~NODE_11739_length_1267_cov_11.246491.p1  ORF type:complete len:151 (-),score=33.03 NODE_11739_length_1267_cov_11.246491:766-1218(-)